VGNRAAEFTAAVLGEYPTAVLMEHGPGSIKHRVEDLSVVGGFRYVLNVTPGLHHKRANTDPGRTHSTKWIENDTEVTDDTGPFEHQDKDALPYRFKMSDAGRRRLMFRQGVPSEFIEFEPLERFNGSTWEVPAHPTPSRVDNRLQWDGGTNWGVGYEVKPHGLKAVYVAKTLTGANPIRWAYTLTGATLVGNTIIGDSDGQPVGVLRQGRLVDAVGVRRDVAVAVNATHVTMTPDYSGLVFPVRVDPTVDVEPGVGADDGNRTSSAWSNTGLPGVGDFSVPILNGWYRFPSVTVPPGSTLGVAYITQARTGFDGISNVDSQIFCIAEDDHVAPTVDGDWTTDHGIHTTGVGWSFTGAGSGNHDTPSIIVPVQAIIDRSGWASGNAIGVHIDDNSSVGDNYQSWDEQEGTTPANLHLEYSSVDRIAAAVLGGPDG